jgi:hypothetical protein
MRPPAICTLRPWSFDLARSDQSDRKRAIGLTKTDKVSVSDLKDLAARFGVLDKARFYSADRQDLSADEATAARADLVDALYLNTDLSWCRFIRLVWLKIVASN